MRQRKSLKSNSHREKVKMVKEHLLEKSYTHHQEPGESHRNNMNSHQSNLRDSLINSKVLSQDRLLRKYKSRYVEIYLKCNLTSICQGQTTLMSSHNSVVKIINVHLQPTNQSLEDILISTLLINR